MKPGFFSIFGAEAQGRGLWRCAPFASLMIIAGLFALARCAGAADPVKPETRINPRDGAVLVHVPAGEFLMGTSAEDAAELLRAHKTWKAAWLADEQPQHTVYLDGYWIYQNDVTVAQFRKFCQATGRKMPALLPTSGPEYPMVNVSWDDAAAYADWAGARLPSEAEWEKAARGTDGRRYPWGNFFAAGKCHNYAETDTKKTGEHERTAPVGSYPDGDSPYGIHDMAGNVWQWCADWYADDYYKNAPARNPRGPEVGEMHVLRGGSWGSSSISVRSAGRHKDAPDATYHDGGFRCAMSAARGR